MKQAMTIEWANLAAKHIAHEGLSYYEAKRKAGKQIGNHAHESLCPSNELVENALREYFKQFMCDTQPAELLRLRILACKWLTRLQHLPELVEPCLSLVVGAVVNGTACEHSPVHLHVYSNEEKHFEIALLNAGLNFECTQSNAIDRNCPIYVFQDQGVPIVISLLPRERYANPIVAGRSKTGYAQTATLTQLNKLIKEFT